MSLTLEQFRTDKNLMREMSKIHGTVVLSKAFEVLDTEHVMRKGLSDKLSPDDKLVRLGEIQGFNRCLEIFRLLFEEPPKPMREIKSTYEEPDK